MPRHASARDPDEVYEGMTPYLDEMMTRLAFCLAVERDGGLQRAIRTFANCPGIAPLYVTPSLSRAWLLLEENRPVRLVDNVQDGVRRFVLNELAADHDLWKDVFSSIARVRAVERAWKLLAPIFNAGASPSAKEIGKLLTWAPVIETFAYQCFTTATILVDGMRRQLLTSPLSRPNRDGVLVDYWLTLHTMGHLLTIASSPAARPWLAAMASSFIWKEWTPSFVLSRERTLWLMAAAAKSAVAFGDAVIDRYLTKLSGSNHPLKSFDALLGLVAIGLDRADLAVAIVAEVAAIGASKTEDPFQSGFLPPMFSSAIETLREPRVAEQKFARLADAKAPLRFAHPMLLGLDALRLDPTTMTSEGQVLGFLALPSIVRSPLGADYPRQSNSLLIRPRDISLILERAWAAAPSDGEPRILH